MSEGTFLVLIPLGSAQGMCPACSPYVMLLGKVSVLMERTVKAEKTLKSGALPFPKMT